MVIAYTPAGGARVRALLCAAVLIFSGGVQVHAADPSKGRELYRVHCEVCHGPSGRGVMVGAPDFSRTDALLRPDGILLEEIKAGKNAMPAYYGMLTDRQILDVITFLRTLH